MDHVVPGTTLLFGSNSLLGWALLRSGRFAALRPYCNRLSKLPAGFSWGRVNLQDREALGRVFEREQPARVIDCSGICRVETCERAPDFAWEVNVVGVRTLLDLLPETTHFIYCSSDHVFGGAGGRYGETATPDPISRYGETRVVAENDIRARRPDSLILRLGVLVGGSHNNRRGDVDWMRYRTARGLPITYVTDEKRTVAWSRHAADRIADMAAARLGGIRHVVGSQAVPRAELADYLNERFDIGARFTRLGRAQRHVPHLGHAELITEFTDELAAPLPKVMPD